MDQIRNFESQSGVFSNRSKKIACIEEENFKSVANIATSPIKP